MSIPLYIGFYPCEEMPELWDQKDLIPPPVTSQKVNHIDRKSLDNLQSVGLKALSVLRNLDVLHKEAAILSRVIYKFKNKFRQDKGFKVMQKIHRCLRNYLVLNLESTYSIFFGCFENSGSSRYAPSCQLLQWLLVKTQGFSKLMFCTASFCEEAFVFHTQKLRLGNLLHQFIMMNAILSRIWCICRHLVRCSCNWYSELFPYLDILPLAKVQWLPEEYTFPKSLAAWLHVPNHLLEEQNSNSTDLEGINLEHSSSQLQNQINRISNPLPLEVDIGEAVSREEFQATNKKLSAKIKSIEECQTVQNSIPSRSSLKSVVSVSCNLKDSFTNLISKHETSKRTSMEELVKSLKSSSDVIGFLKHEAKLREEGTHSLSKHLDMLQWNMLNNSVTMYARKLKKSEKGNKALQCTKLLKHAKRDLLMRLRVNVV